MSTVSTDTVVKASVWEGAWSFGLVSRLSDYLELAKPRIAVMVLLTVSVGYVLGSAGSWACGPWLWACAGIAMAATGASAFNQWLEWETDGLMRRTRRRPLPAGRLSAREALGFAATTSLLGLGCLLWGVNALTAALTALSCVLYAFVYTPLKRCTAVCTAVGAIPGALPPVLGWTAAGHGLDGPAWALFAMLFLWQFPHFLAIAWLYQEDYAAAGLRMLPLVRPRSNSAGGPARPLPHVTGLLALGYAVGLVPVSLLPAALGLAGPWYAAAALVLGALYVGTAAAFACGESRRSARRLLWSSLIYLPVVLIVLAGDHVRSLTASWGPAPAVLAAGTGEN
jgi:protoheme IX farnesyltransferase